MHPVRVPHEQVNDETVLLVDWLIPDRGEVSLGQAIAVIETSKSTAEVQTPFSGYLLHGAGKGAEVPVGAIFCHIAASPAEKITEETPPSRTESIPADPKPASVPATVPDSTDATPTIPISVGLQTPAAPRFSRRALALIEQHGISKEQFYGKGLVREADVLALVSPSQPSAPASAGASARPDAQHAPDSAPPASTGGAASRAEDLPRMKRIEAKYLSWSQNHTLTSVVTVTCPTAGLKAAAAGHPELAQSALPFIIYETARLLRKYSVLNSFHHEGKIHLYEAVNVGIAIDSGRGLKVPVIGEADKKGVTEIAREIEDLMLGYVTGELPIASLSGGTFTVSDLSSEGVSAFHPLINQKQCAILGIGAEFYPSANSDGYFNLILSFDHQLTEGRMAAAFLRDLRERISSYELALRASGKRAEPCCARCLRPASDLASVRAPLLQEVRPNGEVTLICRLCLDGW